MTRSTIVVVALAVSASSSAITGQSRPAFVPQGPVLRASVDQVVVDVVVTDASGAPVTGLTAADFEILERGKPQTIASFSEVSLPLSLRSEGAPLPVPSDVRSNIGTAERRFYVLALDNENVQLRFTADVRKAAHAFVRRIVQPGDVVAVVTSTGLNVGMREFTEDMSLIDAAIERFAGNTPPASLTNRSVPLMSGPGSERNADRMSGSEGSDAAADELARGGSALRTLANLTQSLAGVSGRKAVIFISNGIPIDPGNWATDQHEAVLREVIDGAARANVTIYTFDPAGLDHHSESMNTRFTPGQTQNGRPGADRRARGRMLEELAIKTGGAATIDTNNPLPGLEAVARDSSHYYLLSYASTDTKRDGRYRRIEVRAKRSGLRVRARQGYYAPSDKRQTSKDGQPDTTSPIAAELQALVARPVGSAGLSITAHAVALPTEKNNVRVVVEVAPGAVPEGAGDTATDPANTIDFMVMPVLPGGHSLPSVEGRIALGVADIDDIVKNGVRFVEGVTLPPGAYQLRIALRERARGTSGSVFCDLTVPDLTKNGLVMSDLVLSASGAGRVPSATIDSRLSEVLEGPPTTARSFGADETLRAYTELGETRNGPVELVTVVRDAGGHERLRRPEPPASARPGEGNRLGYAIDLPLEPFAPGRYVLRVEARAGAAPVAREVAFDVTPRSR